MTNLTQNQIKTLLKPFKREVAMSDLQKVLILLDPLSNPQFDVEYQGSKLQIHVNNSPVVDTLLSAD